MSCDRRCHIITTKLTVDRFCDSKIALIDSIEDLLIGPAIYFDLRELSGLGNDNLQISASSNRLGAQVADIGVLRILAAWLITGEKKTYA